MYSDEDINAAVAAGTLTPEAAAGLRAQVSATREMPVGDEENFRLVTSFNDVFVTIGVVILLVAVGSIGTSVMGTDNPATLALGSLAFAIPSLMVAATAWLLGEVFTRKRRLALPSIVLLIAFVWAVFIAALGLIALPLGLMAGVDTLTESSLERDEIGEALGVVLAIAWILGAGAVTVFASWRHWRRFMVPITIAAGASALVGSILAAIAISHDVVTDGQGELSILPLVLIAGLAVFAFAMRWDISDRARTTRRSDVAFWLHLLAAPLIAHPLFASLGAMDGGGAISVAGALGVIAVYVLFGLVALAIDRRALLVSALAYVLVALGFLFDRFGAVQLNFALTALVIGSALLMLSAFWAPIRARVVGALPVAWQARLPMTAPLPVAEG